MAELVLRKRKDNKISHQKEDLKAKNICSWDYKFVVSESSQLFLKIIGMAELV
jgi:hypothetical protein